MRIVSKSKIIRESVPLIIVIIIAFFILPISGVSINNNSAKWLLGASKIFNNQGSWTISPHIRTDPMAPFLVIIASGFKLWGKSVHSASLITRLFFTLEIILIYLIGRIFYNQAVGLISSGLVLTSYGINYIACFIDRDIVFPFFILVFILIYYLTLIRSSYIMAIFTGICLGYALLIKESASVCLGLPIGMAFLAAKGKKWDYGKLGLLVIGSMVIFLVSLAIFVHPNNDSFLSMVQFNAVKGRISSYDTYQTTSWSYLLTLGLPRTLLKYYNTYLQKVTHLNFFIVIGLFLVLTRGLISKKTSDLILAILVLCFLPIILRQGESGLRIGHAVLVYMILYIILAAFVVSCISFFIDKGGQFTILHSIIRKYPRLISNLLILLVGLLLMIVQLFPKHDSTWRLWIDSKHALSALSKKPFKVYGRFTTEQQQAAEWLKKNVPKTAKILADGYSHEALEFFEARDYKIPLFQHYTSVYIPSGAISRRDDSVKPLYLITHTNFNSEAKKHRYMWVIFDEDIVKALKRENPDFFIISGKSLFLRTYFDKAVWACLKFDNQHVRIYRIHMDRIEPIFFDNVGVNVSISTHIDWLEKNYPDEYLLFIKKIEALGLTVENLINSPLRFPRGQIY